ncbi:MAG TPA: helix-turn-helix domain-containing protein [Polyangiaceae bacterium]|nr:helix-turn-helix domain-containing protein [Polyangiaceae bacterium]
MAQRPKEHVRSGFVAAASSLFAEVGFEVTTMAAIAERAGSSIGNMYKYFASKDDLLRAVLPAEFAREVERMTEARIKALGKARDVRLLAPGDRYHVLAGELFDHCLAHRERIVILLGRPEGTPFATFPVDFRKKLVAWALDYVRHAWPEVRPRASMRFALDRIYDSYLAAIATTFAALRKPRAIRDAVAHLTAHHQGGLKALFEAGAGAARADQEGGREKRRGRKGGPKERKGGKHA